jgi:hypothetical protein
MTQFILLFKLLIAHFTSDFILQPDVWIREREIRKVKSLSLVAHVLVHGFVTIIFLLDDLQRLWYIVPVIMVAHYFTDLLKSYQKKNKVFWFLADQALHLIVIAGCWLYFSDRLVLEKFSNIFRNPQVWITVFGVLILTKPTSVFIATATERWRKELHTDKEETLKDAGKWIGVTERILILIFILFNTYEAVGFLLAAKSIFRFGDLKEPKEKNQTEYLIVGTLLSFGIAVVTGLMVRIFI